MILQKNYAEDLLKSLQAPVLLEITANDLGTLKNGEKIESETIVFGIAQKLYDYALTNKQMTNIVFVDTNIAEEGHFVLFEMLLNLITPHLKDLRNNVIVQEGIKSALSYTTGGILTSFADTYIEQGMNFLFDGAKNAVFDFAKNILQEEFVGELESIIHDFTSENLTNALKEHQHHSLYLSSEAKKTLGDTLKIFSKNDISYQELFTTALKLLVCIAQGAPKLLIIQDPHKLDSNSIALLSLWLSYAKYFKDDDKHLGISIIYMYKDISFQLFAKVEDKYKVKQSLMNEQRSFAQRYGILEKLTSDIPQIAIKSSMFVGRKEELESLESFYGASIKDTKKRYLAIVSGEPGIGKTSLVKKHLDVIVSSKTEESHKQITLTLLNQVGHTSLNTGLSSLKNSILSESQRLNALKTFTDKVVDKSKSLTNRKEIVKTITKLLGYDQAINMAKVTYDRLHVESDLFRVHQKILGDFDNKTENEKDKEFQAITRSLQELQKLSDSQEPIIIFIDDLQWIDENTSEYLLTHLCVKFPVYIIATLRASDGATLLSKALERDDIYPYKLSFFKCLPLAGNERIEPFYSTDLIETKTIDLKGFARDDLYTLIAETIKGDFKHLEIFSKTLFNRLSNDINAKYINTLFAIETLNVLCDEKLYSTSSKDIEKLIETKPELHFNTTLKDFSFALEKTFDMLITKYQTSFAYYQQHTTEHNFNLMAYAVLEERMRLLRIYFKDYGNAAVNTLLFASLLGVPFDSNIVSEVLKTLSTTQEPLLAPLKDYLCANNHEAILLEEHYVIMEEVYEILSRYISFEHAYSYKHILLKLFLEAQLEYLLNDLFLEDSINAKDKMYYYIFLEIDKKYEEWCSEFEELSLLNQKQSEKKLFYTILKYNVIRKGFNNNSSLWNEYYIFILRALALSYKDNNCLMNAIEKEEEALVLLKNLYKQNSPQWSEYYISILGNLAISYKNNNRLMDAIAKEEEALAILQKLYVQDSPKWVIESFIGASTNLTFSYCDVKNFKKAIEKSESVFYIIQNLYIQEPNEWVELYIMFLNNLASAYFSNGNLKESQKITEEAFEIIQKLCSQNSQKWSFFYAKILLNMECFNESSIKTEEKALEILQKLYESNPPMYLQDYVEASINLTISYHQNKNYLKKSLKQGEEVFKVLQELYRINTTQWVKYYIRILSTLGTCYYKNKHFDKAIEKEREAIDILEKLYIQNPQQWADDYVRIQNNLASSCECLGRTEEAKRIRTEAQNLKYLTATLTALKHLKITNNRET